MTWMVSFPIVEDCRTTYCKVWYTGVPKFSELIHFSILANCNISVWTILYKETERNLKNMQSDYVISSRDTSRVAIHWTTVSPPWQIAGAHGLQTQKRAWRPVKNEKWNKYKWIVILANMTHSLMSPIIVPRQYFELYSISVLASQPESGYIRASPVAPPPPPHHSSYCEICSWCRPLFW